jgi:hypothetical protein
VSRPLTIGLILLTASALYLVGPARDAMGSVASGVVLLHIGLGLLLIAPVANALRAAWQRARSSERGTACSLAVITALACACALTGVTLFLRAALGHSAARDAVFWWLHILAGFAALLGIGYRVSGIGKKQAARDSQEETATRNPMPDTRYPLLLFCLLVGPGALWMATVAVAYAPEEYYRDLTATNALQAQNPLFPAGMRLPDNVIPSTIASRWQDASYCGRNGCHPAAYHDWLASAHHVAGADPFYARVETDYAARSGTEAARWCAGCHAPATMVGGQRSVTRENQSPTPYTLYPTPSDEGVDCLACHAAVGTPTRTGNGRFTLAVPEEYPFGKEEQGWQRRLHDFLLRVRPGPHQRAFHKPELHGSAEFCSACHRQSFNVPQNHYQFVRGPDEYGEWQRGPFSGRSARAAGMAAPNTTQTCQDCHFPREAEGHTVHLAVGANTASPALRGDTAHLARTETFLQNRVTLDLFALRRTTPGSAWDAPLDAPREGTPPRPGEAVTLDIVVRNRNVGHGFPAGYTDIKDVWLEVRLEDERGRALLVNGALRTDAEPLPPDTHIYRMVALDRAGNAIIRHNLTEQVTTVYRRSIPPGGSDIARYAFTVPERDADRRPFAGPLRLRARLRYRCLRPDFVQWALNGAKPLPITTLAEATALLPLAGVGESPSPSPGPQPPTPMLASRFLDYGLGLIAAPKPTASDLTLALHAFQIAQTLAPARPEPLIGMGRAYLTEPSLLAARARFEEALRLAPNNPAARADLGVVYSKQGEYEQAIQLLGPLAAQFPQDTQLQSDLGLAYYRQGSYEGSAAAFQRALAADPDNAAAHFQLKQCYQRLQRVPDARREEVIGRYLAEDRLAPHLLPDYFKRNPEAQRLARPIPQHELRRP